MELKSITASISTAWRAQELGSSVAGGRVTPLQLIELQLQKRIPLGQVFLLTGQLRNNDGKMEDDEEEEGEGD